MKLTAILTAAFLAVAGCSNPMGAVGYGVTYSHEYYESDVRDVYLLYLIESNRKPRIERDPRTHNTDAKVRRLHRDALRHR